MAARKPRTASSKHVEAYCRAKPDILVTTPFGPQPLVFKVVGKMFALLGTLDGAPVVSLKCDPEQGAMLRATFPNIRPGYHLNKLHWVTLPLDGSLPASLVFELVDGAYDLVASSAPKKRITKKAAVKKPAAKKRAAKKKR